MKQLLLLISTLFFVLQGLWAQPLTGVKTIPGDYATIAAAVVALNTNGVGAGGVTFNVAAGHTESSTGPIELTATGTAGNGITFQKSGAGANPIITRTDAGTLATSTFGGQGDAVITLTGSDYVVFNGIDVAASDEGIEYGYFLRKADGDNGCQFVTIQNATVTMTKGTSQYVIGIYSSNLDPTTLVSSAVGVTVTSNGGRNENVTIISNTIQNVFSGIAIRGFNATTPFDLYDQNFVVGQNGAGNLIQNFGGNASATAYGVYVIYHNGQRIVGNTINNTVSPFTAIGYGVFNSVSSNANINVDSNDITLASNATTNLMQGINVTIAGGVDNTVSISNNNISNCVYSTATTGAFTGIIHSSTTTKNVIMNGNIVNNNTHTGTGAFTGIDGGGGTSPGTRVEMNDNTVQGNTKTGASGSIFYTRASADTVYYMDNLVTNNSFTGTSGTTSCIVYGYYNLGSPKFEELSGNTITNLSVAGANAATASIMYGFHTNTTGTATKRIHGNTINNLSSLSGTNRGISQLLGSDVQIYNNTIHTLENATIVVTTARVEGINVSSGNTYVYNNYIYGLYAPNCASIDGVRGISITALTASTSVGVYYNTIYMNAVSGAANFGTSGIFHTYSLTATTSALDMRNNIIANNSTPSGTGSTVAFRRSAATNLNNFQDANNNSFYAGVPGPNNLIFTDGTNSFDNMAGYTAHVSPRDAQSFRELPPFTNIAVPPYNLVMNTMVPTQTESGGAPVTAPLNITTDYFGTLRNISTPDVGAEEFDGTLLDLTPPNITYTPFSSTSITGVRTLTATITDPSGVPTAGIGLPVLYWSINNIAGPFTAATGSYIAGDDYQFNFGADAVLGDVVYYYVVAQDEVTTPNVGSNPGGGSGYTPNPPAASTPPPAPHQYQIVPPLSGIIPVGIGETYTSLTADAPDGLFKAINASEVTGDITIQVTTDLTETGAIFLNEATQVSPYTISIVPSSASMRTISGNVSGGGVITLNGADVVVIDGSFMGSGRYLTIENTNTATNSAAIRLISLGSGMGATNNTITNCIIMTGNIGTTTTLNTFGIYIGGPTITNSATGSDNDNNTISNNIIKKARYGIYARGTSVADANDNLMIIDNEIGSDNPAEYVTFRGIDMTNADGALISGNYIHDLKITLTASNAGIDFGVGVSNSEISGNTITGVYSESTNGYGAYGINFSSGTNVTNNSIINNVISDIRGVNYSSASTTFNGFGIRLAGGTNTKVFYNSVNLFGNITIVSGAPTQPNSAALIVTATNVTGLEVVNNVLVNTQQFVSGSPKTYSVWVPTSYSGFLNINNNDYYGTATAPATYHVGRAGVVDYSTLLDWQGFTTQDANSISADPLFTSANNLRPSVGSPLFAAGTPIAGITTDITGDARSGTTPSIGAYENSQAAKTWLGTTSTAWETGTNWNNGVPIATDNVIIAVSANNPLLTTAATVNSLSIDNGAVLTLSNDGQLTVNGTLTNNAGNGGLVLQSNASGTGSLMHNTDNVAATIQRYITGSNDLDANHYHQVSVPMAASNNPLSDLFLGSYLYYYDQPTQDFVSTGTSTTIPLDVSRGYLLYYPSANITYNFEGTMNNGTFTTNIAWGNVGGYSGYNLVPNPYPSAMNWEDESWTKENIKDAIWIWNPVAQNYAAYGSQAGTNGATPYIPVGQAFFVQANSSDPAPELSMNNDVRMHNEQTFFKDDALIHELLRLRADANGRSDEMIVRFREDAYPEFGKADVAKMYGNLTSPQLYSLSADMEKLTINAYGEINEELVVPVGFEMSGTQEITLTFSSLESFDPLVEIFFEDLLENKMLDVRENAYYTFIHTGGNGPMRFRIHFKGVTSVDGLGATATHHIWSHNDNIYLSIPEQSGKAARIELFGLLGNKLMETSMKLENPSILQSPATGIVIVRITAGNRVYTNKLIIR